MNEFVLIYHPALGDRRATVPLRAVDDWALRGWLLVDPNGGSPPAPVPVTTATLDAATAALLADHNSALYQQITALIGAGTGTPVTYWLLTEAGNALTTEAGDVLTLA